jgi:TRAP-type transport system periplasmic protein
VRFAASVGRRSKGQLTIDVYPSAQLAKEQESIDAIRTGVLDFTMQAGAFLIPLAPQHQVLALPFIFKDLAAGYRVLDGPIGTELFAALEPKGIIGLAWVTSNFKQIETTSKAIVTPADMKGLRIRIVAGTVQVATYQALGAVPVIIDVTEVYTALSQRTVDGMEVSLDSFTAGKWYAVAKHVAMSNHFFTVTPLMASKRRMESLPAPLQKILKEEGKAILSYVRSIATQREADAIQLIKANGGVFTDIQYAEFRKAVEPVYAAATASVGRDFMDRVTRAAGSARG